ncbi:MAG: CoA transferase, partial [Candidatus Binatia bacterium]
TEVVASVAHICGAGKYFSDGIVPKRFGTGLFASVPSGAYACKDGIVYLMVNRPGHWQALAAWINEVTGNREVLDPMFDGPSSVRQPYRELLDLFISELTATMTVEKTYREAQRRHIAMTPVNTALGVAADEHLDARAFFVDVAHADGVTLRYPGPPFRPALTPWSIRARAPLPGEHDAEILAATTASVRAVDGEARSLGVAAVAPPVRRAGGALAGVRVLELTAGMAGPWIGRFMAWCGADVIKVESTDYPDVTRLYVPPSDPAGGIRPTLSPWFTDWNAGKRFVALDLTAAEGVEICKRLVAKSDVVVENYTPGVLSKLGLDWPALHAVNDALVMLSSSGFGQSGPDSRHVTWGPNIEALAGMSSLSGFAHRDCTMTQYAYPDPLSALHGLFAVMAALDHRERGGAGQYIDLSQYETSVAAIGHVLMETLARGSEPARRGNDSADALLQGCYRCADEDGDDDRWCAVTVHDDEAWRGLCRALGRDDRLGRDTPLDEVLRAWSRERTAEDVMRALQAEGVAAGVVQTARDQLERDEQLAARGHFESIIHHELGLVKANGIPLGLTGTPGETTDTGRSIGHDNQAVLGELLGMPADEIAERVAHGVVQTDQTPHASGAAGNE